MRREVELSPFTPATTVTHSPFKFLLIPHSLKRVKRGQIQNRGTEGEEAEKMGYGASTPQTNERPQGGKTVKETWEKVRKWAMEKWLDEYPNNEWIRTERTTTERADEADVHGRTHKRHNYVVKVNCASWHSCTGEDRNIWSIYHSNVCASYNQTKITLSSSSYRLQ